VNPIEPKPTLAAIISSTPATKEFFDKKIMVIMQIMYDMNRVMKSCYDMKQETPGHDVARASCDVSIEEIDTRMRSANVLLTELLGGRASLKATPSFKNAKRVDPGTKPPLST
jgi:hypothetical protein